MSDIAPLGRPAAAAYSQSTRASRPTPAVSPSGRPSDRVELSRAAQLLSKLREMPDVRQGLVDRVRQQIADGTYETPEKLDGAIDGLVNDLEA